MTRESEVKSIMVKSVRDHGGYARRIEDQWAVGIPDTILIPVGHPVFFVEVKMVTGQRFGPTPRQFLELARIDTTWASKKPRHAIPILVGWKGGTFFFHEVAQVVLIQDCFSVTSGGYMDFHDQLCQFYTARIYK